MELEEFYTQLTAIVPEDTAEDFDRIGIQVQSGVKSIRSILIALEVNEPVIREAVERQANLIVAFHPLIFPSLEQLVDRDRVGRLVTQLIQQRIALIIAHTNVDAHPRGTNTVLAERLGMQVLRPLRPHPDRPDFGMGRIAMLPQPLTISALLDRLYKTLNCPLRFTGETETLIKTVAIVAGSGRSFLSDAITVGVDAFITSDLKYHDFHEGRESLVLVEAGHYEMEQFVPVILERFIAQIPGIEAIPYYRSQTVTNPVWYYPQGVQLRRQQQEILIERKG